MKLKEEYSKHQQIYNKGYRFNPDEHTFYVPEDSIESFIKPVGYADWEVTSYNRFEYRDMRLNELGITPEENKVRIKDKDGYFSESQIFIASTQGDIDIIQYNLHRESILKEGTTTSAGTRWIYAAQRRINPLFTKVTEGKYDFTDAKNTPFWHPEMIRLFEENIEVEQLVITEGQFKAFKAVKEGVPTVGLTSISHFKDNKTKTIHTEIIEFIKVCKVKKVVILWDGDCRNISLKALENEEDLKSRPNSFYWFAYSIEMFLQDFFPKRGKHAIATYFATIKSEEINGETKGIDDLLITNGVSSRRVTEDIRNIGELPGNYIHWINISNEKGIKDMRKFFNLNNVQLFYDYHKENIGEKDFVFEGTTYRVENGEPIREIPQDLKNYLRIGGGYYKIQHKPFPKFNNKQVTLQLEKTLTPWPLAFITRDYGKDADTYIPKYEGFINIPDNINYSQVINGYWNLYDELDHKPVEGDFPNIKKLLRHLFQDKFENEMIYDYFSILYRYPFRKLPVICLVSEEQDTGKSTFVGLLRNIFKNNMTLINSKNLTEDFNDHWVSKLIVASEETFLDKKEAYEALKNLTTTNEITRSEKNVSSSLIPCALHFVFCSNHEDTFIKISKYDTRLWVNKVNSIAPEDRVKYFDRKLEEETPYFVDFIINRDIKYKDVGHRLWFHHKDFQTEAFDKLVLNTQPEFIKDLRLKLEEYFELVEDKELNVSVKDLKEHFDLPSKHSSHQVNRLAEELLFAIPSKGVSRYEFKVQVGDNPGEYINISGIGRHLTFKRESFIN